jgi:hypothetical protein
VVVFILVFAKTEKTQWKTPKKQMECWNTDYTKNICFLAHWHRCSRYSPNATGLFYYAFFAQSAHSRPYLSNINPSLDRDSNNFLNTKWVNFLITMMMEAVNTSETSVNFYQTTRRNIPEDGHLHIWISQTSFMSTPTSIRMLYNTPLLTES